MSNIDKEIQAESKNAVTSKTMWLAFILIVLSNMVQLLQAEYVKTILSPTVISIVGTVLGLVMAYIRSKTSKRINPMKIWNKALQAEEDGLL